LCYQSGPERRKPHSIRPDEARVARENKEISIAKRHKYAEFHASIVATLSQLEEHLSSILWMALVGTVGTFEFSALA
jgi:hypothetical protein